MEQEEAECFYISHWKSKTYKDYIAQNKCYAKSSNINTHKYG